MVDTVETARLLRSGGVSGTRFDVSKGRGGRVSPPQPSGLFCDLYPHSVDEEEHCIEMHLPYLLRTM